MKRRGLIIGAVGAVICLIALISLFFAGGRVSFLQNGVGGIMKPVETGIRNLVGALEQVYDYIFKYDTMEAEYQAALDDLAEYQEKVRRAEELEDENDRLREMLNLTKEQDLIVKVDAYVISWDASNWTSAFTIDEGEDRGVEVGAPVITHRGELVGTVIEVGSNWSIVATTIDPDFGAGALMSSGKTVVAEGNFALMQEGYLRLSYVPSGEIPLMGDVITTSGLGEVIPKGLIIGEVIQVEMEDSGASYYAIIEPAVDFDSLTQVFIIQTAQAE